MLYRMRDLLGISIWDLSNGEKIGRLRDILIDRKPRQVIAFLIEPEGLWGKIRILAISDIKNIGPNGIMVENPVLLEKVEREVLAGQRKVRGMSLITEEGKEIGRVSDLVFDFPKGKISDWLLTQKFLQDVIKGRRALADEFILVLGKNAIIVVREAENYLRVISEGLEKQWREWKETGWQVGEKLFQEAKEWGENLSEKITQMEMDYLVGKSLAEDIVDEEQQVVIKKDTLLTSEDLLRAKEKKLLHKVVLILGKEKALQEAKVAKEVTTQKIKELRIPTEKEAWEKTRTLQEKISQKIKDWKMKITKRKEGN